MKIRIPLFIALLCVNWRICISQQLPKVIPPSPSAMQFQKYGDYPVGNFTGVPEISVPLYTIKEGDLELPITLSYHASGVKPTDPNGFVGLGWTLNAGGKITRTIMDETDETRAVPSPFYTAAQLSAYNYSQLAYIMEPLEGYQDTEPDIFSYNFGKNSGKFVLKRDAGRAPLLIPYKPLKIAGHIPTTGASVFDYFDVTDESGFQYRFYKGDSPSAPGSEGFTGWNIQAMTSPLDASNQINFTYATGPIERMAKRVDKFASDDDMIDAMLCRSCLTTDGSDQPCESILPYLDYAAGESYREDIALDYDSYVNSDITFRSGKIRFVKNPTTRMLDSMIIYNASNVMQKFFKFEYLQRPTLRVLLKSIKIYDANKQFVNQYSFSYNSEQYSFPGTESAGTDYWGYYNGSMGTSLMPNWEVYLIGWGSRQIGTNRRETDENYMKTFVLERINYPTGGSTFFNYEANRYRGNGAITGYRGDLVGGLRIKEIIHYTDQNQVAETRSYKYSAYGYDESGWGIMDVYPGKEHFSYSQRSYFAASDRAYFPWESFRRVYYSSEPYTNLCPNGSPVVYPYVTEYIGDGQKNIGKTVYEYDYNEAEYQTYETNTSTDQHAAPILYRRYLKPCKEWRSGQNSRKTVYKNVNGIYTEVYSETNEYEEVSRERLQALHMDRFVIYLNDPCGNYSDVQHTLDEAVFSYGHVIPGSVFNYGDYFFDSGEKRLKSITVKDHGLTTVTSYDYGNAEHVLPTKKTITNSKGDNIITTFKYPHDFVSTAPYNQMVSTRHIWSPVIEEANYKNSTSAGFLNSTRTNYGDWGSNIIAPVTVETKKGTAAAQVRIRFNSYDNRGHVTSVSKEKDVVISYLWGYDKTLPVAEVQGATYATVSGLLKNPAVLDNWQSTDQQMRTELDNVRTGLAGTKAQVTTYTYKPLVGMSSHTDPNGRITYYEYDGMGRLQHIRDEDQNILKKYSYAYLGLNEQGRTEAVPQWQATGVTRSKLCPLNSNFLIGTETQEKDINTASLTYNQFRWTSTGGSTGGTDADWQYTNTPVRCRADQYGYNTGEQERELINMNPCSNQYNERRWVVVGTNYTACPRPSSFTSDDQSGEYYSQWCDNGEEPNVIYVSAPAGMFTSTISKLDANQKAYNYAQNYANEHGTCRTLPVTINFMNRAYRQSFDVYLTNVSTDESFSFYTSTANGTLGEVPPGNYDIRIEPSLTSSYSFTVGCDNSLTGPRAEFFSIPINVDCNAIVVE